MAYILVVDDYYEVAEWIGAILTRHGHEADVCLSGTEACVKVVENNYDLVITDIVMAEPDGLEFCKYIREDLPPAKNDVPIIAISGGSSSITPRIALTAASRYADLIMEKPLSQEILRKAVEYLLDSKARSEAQT